MFCIEVPVSTKSNQFRKTMAAAWEYTLDKRYNQGNCHAHALTSHLILRQQQAVDLFWNGRVTTGDVFTWHQCVPDVLLTVGYTWRRVDAALSRELSEVARAQELPLETWAWRELLSHVEHHAGQQLEEVWATAAVVVASSNDDVNRA